MLKSLKLLQIIFVYMAALLISCSPEDDDAGVAELPSEDPPEEACLVSGDVVVSSSASDSLMVFNSDGTFKRMIFSVSSASESLYGITWSSASNEILAVVDGVDRVVAVSAEDCTSRVAVLDVNLTGTVRGITQLPNGDILVVETNNIERFGANGTRITTGWPLAAQTAGTGVSALSNGGFVHCSSTSDVVRTYNAAGTQVATRASGIGATTDAMDCMNLASGQIATTWSGTTDTVSIYDASLNPVASYSNTSVIGAPGGIAQRPSGGNLLVVDRVFNYVVEISLTGTLVGTFGAGYLSTPEFIVVVP